ncbi:hypothetical protein [Chondrinema litorale]|uniref:hypothetical protein n=1 Tax=Chondrinema litorale TaxID=2994555 RepID=UPI002542E7D8|nr:hypothetical protein [Chondrinema litorale]UZR96791.1 hypothetical protein OQ292_24130 [Chondrinema litorale]
MIKQSSPDKVRGRLVKYKLGDCLAIRLGNGDYLGALMTGKFNTYYNLTFMAFCKHSKPEMIDYELGQFFGTRFGSWEDLTYAVDQRMIECHYTDKNSAFEKIGSLDLISNFISAGYSYLNDIEQILEYYKAELPIRIEKSKNAEKFPEIAFVSKHLIEMKRIMK